MLIQDQSMCKCLDLKVVVEKTGSWHPGCKGSCMLSSEILCSFPICIVNTIHIQIMITPGCYHVKYGNKILHTFLVPESPRLISKTLIRGKHIDLTWKETYIKSLTSRYTSLLIQKGQCFRVLNSHHTYVERKCARLRPYLYPRSC
jgi:hypothetical protein